MRFSERMGYRPIREALQVEDMDAALRNRIWNCVYTHVFATIRWDRISGKTYSKNYRICCSIWTDFFKERIDRIPRYVDDISQILGSAITGEFAWYEVFDFLEFLFQNYGEFGNADELQGECNQALQEECAGYRLIDGMVTQVTNVQEIEAIEAARTVSALAVETHLEAALRLLSDRKNPDYRNSIKESISSVEALCCKISGNDKASLGQALGKMEDQGYSIHPSLKESFKKLYGYTSDAEGIRHALLEEPTLTFDDAKFMLVACSAFINLLTARSVQTS